MSIKNSYADINWLENFVTKECITCYEYSDFKNVQQIGKGSFGNVVRVNWKTTNHSFALKSFDNGEITLKEVVNEVSYENNLIILIIINYEN